MYENIEKIYRERPFSQKSSLKDDGILFFTAHTKYSLFTLLRVAKRDIFKCKNMEHLDGVEFYSANYYKKLLEKNGFEIILQDGYNTSFLLYPFYEKIVRGLEEYFKKKLLLAKPYIDNGIVGKIKSEISYHSVFIARKKKAQFALNVEKVLYLDKVPKKIGGQYDATQAI